MPCDKEAGCWHPFQPHSTPGSFRPASVRPQILITANMTVKENNSVAIEPVSRDAEDIGLQAEQRVVRKLDVSEAYLVQVP